MQKAVKILYTNYRKETAVRTIVPKQIVFSKNEYHPEEQWLLIAEDLDKKAERTFALKDVKAWFLK